MSKKCIHARSPMTLTDFLLARIADDEAVARAASGSTVVGQAPGPWQPVPSGDQWEYAESTAGDVEVLVALRPDLPRPPEVMGGMWGAVVGTEYAAIDDPLRASGRHIARHDPARVLAECEAKRRIVEFHKSWPVLVETPPTFETGGADYPNSLTFRMSKQIAWTTEQQYRERFGSEPPNGPILLALAAVYADHEDYREEWRV